MALLTPDTPWKRVGRIHAPFVKSFRLGPCRTAFGFTNGSPYGIREVRMNKQKVTLSLDPEIYARTKEVLKLLPVNVSVSALIDELLSTFAGSVLKPMKDAHTSGQNPRDFYKALHADMLSMVSLEFADLIRTLDEQETKKQHAKR